VSSQVADWVLSGFKPEEKALLQDRQEDVFALIEEFLK
jgi:hypothetical protein